MKNLLLPLSSLAAATILLTSCGSGDNSLGDPTGAPPNAEAFVGSTVSFNPTITFSANNIIEYVNEEVGSPFPQAPSSSPAVGTYTYTSAPGNKTATMTITLPSLDGGVSEEIELTDFVVQEGLVVAFTMVFDTEGTYVATVETGSIKAAGKRNSGFPDLGPTGGGSGGGSANDFTFGEDGNIVGDTTFSKANTSTIYSGFYGGGALTYSPLPVHTVGQEVSFFIAESGNFEMEGIDRRLGTGPYTLSVPYVGSEEGILTYRGFDAQSGGTMLVTFDVENTNVLTVKWDDNTFSDYEQQSFE